MIAAVSLGLGECKQQARQAVIAGRVTVQVRNPADREHSFRLNVNTDSGSS